MFWYEALRRLWTYYLNLTVWWPPCGPDLQSTSDWCSTKAEISEQV
jgi:hypothetical protein